MKRRNVLLALVIALFSLSPAMSLYCLGEEDDVSKVEDVLDNLISTAERVVLYVINRFTAFVVSVARAIYVTLILTGAVLRFSGISYFRGRELMIGGIVLFILTEALDALGAV